MEMKAVQGRVEVDQVNTAVGSVFARDGEIVTVEEGVVSDTGLS